MLRIKDLLKEKGVTAKELAERIGVSQPAISFAINGNPTVETLEKIANALDVTIHDLFEPFPLSVHTVPSPDPILISGNTPSEMIIDIKSAIKRHGVKIGDLADRMGVSRQSIHYYCEQGDKNPISQLKRISEAIGCDISEFWDSGESSSAKSDFVALVSLGGETKRFDSVESLRGYLSTIEGE